MVMLRLQDLRRSSCNRLSSSGKVMCRLALKIYNVVAKIKKNRMQGRNTVEEVLCLSAQRSYTVFYRNREETTVLSDIVVAHLTSIAMIRTWPYVLIMDTTYKTNKHIDQNVLAKLTEMVKDEDVAQRVWTSQVLHFGVETTNHVESEHLVLKLWLSTCHGDLDTVFFNIDSLIDCQIGEIKYSLEISKLKEKFSAKSNAILKNRKLEIDADIPDIHERDMDSEMRILTLMLEEISTGPISKVREVRRLIKDVICPALFKDPCPPLTKPPETIVTKGRRKTFHEKEEYVSIVHRKIGKSSGSGLGREAISQGQSLAGTMLPLLSLSSELPRMYSM
ncbi:hypothetical protein M9H77_27988 [Catharanthus roseus]|uniref:Uncharacterized protein n=1 Tax=Catharanthus roseus TaxID=4058 RepID=A0ACC0AFY6_CATRO|nr:hypothetical protein M9H77_27988 [Catharanthus roseus]